MQFIRHRRSHEMRSRSSVRSNIANQKNVASISQYFFEKSLANASICVCCLPFLNRCGDLCSRKIFDFCFSMDRTCQRPADDECSRSAHWLIVGTSDGLWQPFQERTRLMSTLIHATPETTNACVQTFFHWDTLTQDNTLVAEVTGPKQAPSKTTDKKNSKPIAHPSTENARQRRVGCEHVGSALATVLGGYGISIDALISEIERLKSAK